MEGMKFFMNISKMTCTLTIHLHGLQKFVTTPFAEKDLKRAFQPKYIIFMHERGQKFAKFASTASSKKMPREGSSRG